MLNDQQSVFDVVDIVPMVKLPGWPLFLMERAWNNSWDWVLARTNEPGFRIQHHVDVSWRRAGTGPLGRRRAGAGTQVAAQHVFLPQCLRQTSLLPHFGDLLLARTPPPLRLSTHRHY